jgi:hypothetical protein
MNFVGPEMRNDEINFSSLDENQQLASFAKNNLNYQYNVFHNLQLNTKHPLSYIHYTLLDKNSRNSRIQTFVKTNQTNQ